MRKYLIKRILQIAITLWIFLTIVFLILEAQPGSIANVYINNPRVTPEAKQALIKQLGLDEPLYMKYIYYLRNFFTGNLGDSFVEYPRPVWDIIKERLPRTVVLFFTAALLSYLVGFQLGKLIAWKRKGIIDYTSTIGGVLLFTVYTPWFALLLIWIFAVSLHLLPIGKFLNPELWRLYTYTMDPNTVFGYVMAVGGGGLLTWLGTYLAGRRLRLPRSTFVSLNLLSGVTIVGVAGFLSQGIINGVPVGALALDIVQHMVLPVMVLFCITFAGAMLIMRDSMLDVVREDYVFAAKAKGLPDRVVRNKHAARNALLPIMTAFILAIAFTVDGGIITETIFSWPGMGLTLLNSTLAKDVPVAVGVFVFTGFFALIAHLVADILYAYLDPRIRYS